MKSDSVAGDSGRDYQPVPGEEPESGAPRNAGRARRRRGSSRRRGLRIGAAAVAVAVGVATVTAAVLTGSASAATTQRGPDPTVASVAANRGTFATAEINVPSGFGFNGGKIYYPTDTSQGTWGAIAAVPGYTATWAREGAWMGPWLASFGFVVIGIDTNSPTDGDSQRGTQLLAALDYLTGQSAVRDRVDPNRLAVLGHSMGGGGAINAAMRRPSLKAAVPLAPASFSQNLSNVRVPMLIMGARDDGTIPPSTIDGLWASKPASTKAARVELTSGSHAFPTWGNSQVTRREIPWLKIFLDNDSRYAQFLCPSLMDSTGVSRYVSECPYGSPAQTTTSTTRSTTSTTSTTSQTTQSTTESTSQSTTPGTGPCSATYTVTNAWPGGFQGTVSVRNTGAALTSWTIRFSMPSGDTITQGWGGTWTTGGSPTVTNASYNGNVGTGASIELGFIGSGSGSGSASGFTLNGAACSGGGTGGGTTSTTTTTGNNNDTTTTTTTGASNGYPYCVNGSASDPDGDGWGWENNASCIVRGSAADPSGNTTTTTTSTTTTSQSQPPGGAPALHVVGNRLVTSSGATYRLLGVNRSGGEFACIQGTGMWNGPMDQASINAMKTWNIHTVRVPLNEECWLGTGDVPSGGVGGTTYQNNVKAYVNLLLSSGITPLVEMHWNYGQYSGPSSGCSDVKATCQKPMPDAQYAPSFWTGVANAFKDNRVVFDLFNEPYPERATGNAASGWKCWRDGGSCSGIGYQVAGFQSLVNAVRATGNTNVILLGGLAYSNDLSQWLQYKPTDSTGNLAAFAHIYNFNSCANASCFNSQMAPVAAQVPLTLSEIGENDCGSSFINTVMNWADSHGVGYLAWTWNNWNCSTGPSLISDYNGTATNFGAGFKAHLLAQTP